MIYKLFAVVFVVCAIQHGASATGGEQPPVCNGGSVNCCNKYVEQKDAAPLEAFLALLGIKLSDIGNGVGLTCSPLTVIGVGGQSCNQQTVCCTNNNFQGVVAIGCTPVNINVR